MTTPYIKATKEGDAVMCTAQGFGEDIIRMWAHLTAHICEKLQITLDELVIASAYITQKEEKHE